MNMKNTDKVIGKNQPLLIYMRLKNRYFFI